MPKRPKGNAKNDNEQTEETKIRIAKASNHFGGFRGRGKPKGRGKPDGGGRPYIPEPPSIEPPEKWTR